VKGKEEKRKNDNSNSCTSYRNSQSLTLSRNESSPVIDRPFNQQFDVVNENIRQYLTIPADLLSCASSYHVVYRCSFAQTVKVNVNAISGHVELVVHTEPLFACEYGLTEASKLIPKPKRERHFSIVPINFPNDAAIGMVERKDIDTPVGRIVELIIPRIKAPQFSLDAPLTQQLKPRSNSYLDVDGSDSPPAKRRKNEVSVPQEEFVFHFKDTIQEGDLVQIWFDENKRYYRGTIVSYDPTKEIDNTEVRWGNNKTEIVSLNIKNLNNDPDDDERWNFLKKVQK